MCVCVCVCACVLYCVVCLSLGGVWRDAGGFHIPKRVCQGGVHVIGAVSHWVNEFYKTLKRQQVKCLLALTWLKCCFMSTETVGLLVTGAQDVHLDFHTAPELCR